MNEKEKNTLGELIGATKDLNEKQKIYLAGVVDGLKASKGGTKNEK